MKQIKRIFPDGREIIYRCMNDAAREVGVTSTALDFAARYGYESCGCTWQKIENDKPLPYELRIRKRKRRTDADALLPRKRLIIIATICRLCGEKEADVRQLFKRRRPKNLQAIMDMFVKWYVKQTEIYISSDLWIETINKLKNV